MRKFVSSIDLFTKQPELYYRKEAKVSSFCGGLSTIIYSSIYIAILIYKLTRMFIRKVVIFYDTNAYKDIPSIELTNEELYGGFSIGNTIDETIYYVKAKYIKNVKILDKWENETKDLDIETCKLENFGTRHQKFFKDKSLDNLYCLKDVKIKLEGYSYLNRYSYINIQIYPCVNQTKDGRKCKDYDLIKKFFTENEMEFKMQDNLLTPERYKNPVEPQEKDITCPIFLQMYQHIFSYIQIVFIETDEDMSGINYWSKKRIEKYPKYSDSFIISAPGTEEVLKTGGPISDITLQLAATVLTQRRKYPSIIDVLGEVGGLMEFIYSFFNIICSNIINTLYNKYLVNELFSYNIKRKTIFIKKYFHKSKNYKDFEGEFQIMNNYNKKKFLQEVIIVINKRILIMDLLNLR